MEILHSRCAGLDVHKDTVVACARVVSDGGVEQDVKTFGTTTKELLALSDFLGKHGVTHVVMESTGVYWKPVWHVLEGSFELILANAQHVRNVPGRKTDVNDAMWLADLLAHGLVRGSFVPPTPIQALRGLTRTRKQLVREKAQHVLRIQKTLEDANLKIASVLSDLMGKSGRAMLAAIVDGQIDPEKLADLASSRVKANRSQIVESLRGRIRPDHIFLLKLHLEQVDSIDKALDAIEKEAGSALEPFRVEANLLIEIPGISAIAAQSIVSEIGVDMSRFATAGHLISWARLCPKNDESAGKRRSTRIGKGGWLKTLLVQSAWSATRAHDTYLRAQFLRIKSRRGPKKAIMAVAASILTAIYYMLRDGISYQDLGPDHFDKRDKSKTILRLVRRLNSLGCEVEIKPAA